MSSDRTRPHFATHFGGLIDLYAAIRLRIRVLGLAHKIDLRTTQLVAWLNDDLTGRQFYIGYDHSQGLPEHDRVERVGLDRFERKLHWHNLYYANFENTTAAGQTQAVLNGEVMNQRSQRHPKQTCHHSQVRPTVFTDRYWKDGEVVAEYRYQPPTEQPAYELDLVSYAFTDFQSPTRVGVFPLARFDKAIGIYPVRRYADETSRFGFQLETQMPVNFDFGSDEFDRADDAFIAPRERVPRIAGTIQEYNDSEFLQSVQARAKTPQSITYDAILDATYRPPGFTTTYPHTRLAVEMQWVMGAGPITRRTFGQFDQTG